MTYSQGFSSLGGCPTQSFYNQKLVIISTPSPELCHLPGLLWFLEEQPSATGSLESHLLRFLARCEQ